MQDPNGALTPREAPDPEDEGSSWEAHGQDVKSERRMRTRAREWAFYRFGEGRKTPSFCSDRMSVVRLVATEYVTLDGVIEDPGGGEGSKHGAWSFPFWNDEAAKVKYDELVASDALLLAE